MVIRAFNIELARIPDTVSTTTIGALRYQFWRDAISDAFNGSPRQQPVSLLLARTLEILGARTEGTATLSKHWFMRVIATREQYSDGRPYPDLAALETYAENTYSTLMYLTLQSLPMSSLTADHIASHIGKASGIVAVLRGLPLVAFPPPPNHHSKSGSMGDSLERGKQGTVMLPLDVMARAGLQEEDVLRQGPEAPGLKDTVFEVATRANDHLITAREMMKNVREGMDIGHAYEHADDTEHSETSQTDDGMLSKEQRQLQDVERAYGIFMDAIAAQSWLDRLQKANFDLFSTQMRKKDWKLPFRAYGAYRKRTF